LACYRAGKGCNHWFGFGHAAWTKYNRLLAEGRLAPDAEKPHMLYAERYVPPKIIPGGAEGRRTLTTEDPALRLQSGAFCAECLQWANMCYWRCEVCNEGDWGFCNGCVNTGRCCSHALLPLVYTPPQAQAQQVQVQGQGQGYDQPPPSPAFDRPMPTAASILTSPNAVKFGNFQPLSFRVECDLCHYPIPPTTPRLHCYACRSGLPGKEQGDYDICAGCYNGLVAKRRVSAENGPAGWRRCLHGHRMCEVGFADVRGGQVRRVLRDVVGGRELKEEDVPGAPELLRYSWPDLQAGGFATRLVTKNVAHAVAPQLQVGSAVGEFVYPPSGGVGFHAVALWSWLPGEGQEDELYFVKGAEITEAVDVNGDWMFGGWCGRRGLFPSPYVRVVGDHGR
jgi:hypothetical protein